MYKNMNKKVYFDKEKYGQWFVEDLEDFYIFKSVNYQTNEEVNQILSWSRNYSLENMNADVVRVYDVEIEDIKYYFLFRLNADGTWDVISEDPLKLEKLLNEKSLFFVGETKVVE